MHFTTSPNRKKSHPSTKHRLNHHQHPPAPKPDPSYRILFGQGVDLFEKVRFEWEISRNLWKISGILMEYLWNINGIYGILGLFTYMGSMGMYGIFMHIYHLWESMEFNPRITVFVQCIPWYLLRFLGMKKSMAIPTFRGLHSKKDPCNYGIFTYITKSKYFRYLKWRNPHLCKAYVRENPAQKRPKRRPPAF